MKLLKNPLNKESILTAAGRLYDRLGYAATTLDAVAEEASIESDELKEQVGDKASLCAFWLSDIHERSEKRHKEILASNDPPLKKVSLYFEHLKNWMEEFGYSGCPFTNASNSMGNQEVSSVREEIRLHKYFVCDFFVQLSEHFTQKPSEAEWLGRSLFLLYSAGTTEAKNLHEVWPIEHAARLAVQLCEDALKGEVQPE